MSEDMRSPESIAFAAQKIADRAQRDVYVANACAGNEELLREVQALLDEALLANRDLAATIDSTGETGQADDPSYLGGNVIGQLAGDMTSAAGVEHARKVVYPKQTSVAGQLIGGRYRLQRCVGEGGMGSVWAAEQREPVKRTVALKLIKSGMNSRDVLARFDAERQALALMDHPNIARIYDGGITDNGTPFFVMELVKGLPITEYCDQHKLTLSQRLQLFVPVCQAIQHAHHKGIIHRDIKPSNVLVTTVDDKPVAKVIDFGVAKATGPSLTDLNIDTGFAIVGTPQYMSPEQASINQIDIDTRSDVYSLGVLLYELLAGSPPFRKAELAKAGYQEILRVIREEEPPRPSTKLSTADALPKISALRGTDPKQLTLLLRTDLDWIVMRALEKDRSRRYETANAFAMDISRYLNGEPVQAHPPSSAYRIKKFLRKNRGPVLAGTTVAVALVLGFVGTSIGMIEAFRQANLARQQEEIAIRQSQIADRERASAQEERNNAETQLKLAVQRLTSSRKTISAVVNSIPNLLERVPLAGQAQRAIMNQMAELLTQTSEGEQADADFESSRLWGRQAVEYRLGMQAQVEGNLKEAEARYRAASKIADEVYKGTPRDRAKAAGNLAVANMSLANCIARAQPDEAIRLMRESIRLREEALAVEAAEDSRAYRLANLGSVWSKLAALQLIKHQSAQLPQTTELTDAMANCRKAIAMLEQAIGDQSKNLHDEVIARREMTAAALDLAKIAEEMKDQGNVLAGYRLATTQLQKLMELEPERIYYRIALAEVYADHGDYLLIQMHNAAEARPLYVENMKLLRQLNDDTHLKQIYENRVLAYYRLGLAAEADGNRDQVKRYFERAALMIELRLREGSDEPAAKADPNLLVDERILLMLVQAWAGQAEPAIRTAQQLRAKFEAVTASDEKPKAADSLARVAFAMAIVSSKAELSDEAKQAGRREALATFKSAIAKGFNDIDYVQNDPDVGPLRQIEGFEEQLEILRTAKQ